MIIIKINMQSFPLRHSQTDRTTNDVNKQAGLLTLKGSAE